MADISLTGFDKKKKKCSNYGKNIHTKFDEVGLFVQEHCNGDKRI